MGFQVIKRDTLSLEYREHARLENIKINKIFMLVLVFICLLLWIDNSDATRPYDPSQLFTYSNIAGCFTFLFFVNWLIFIFCERYKRIQSTAVWTGLLEIFVFIFCLGYMDLKQGSGLMAPAMGYVVIAVLFSTRRAILISLFLINGVIFYYLVSQLDGISIENYRVALISTILLSVIIFLTTENRRRIAFETQRMLAKKVDELNHALDVKSVFFGHMSHELRTPLNAIIGFSDMLLHDTYQPKTIEKIKEYVGFINSGGTHLLKIVNDILDQSKIEAGAVNAVLEELNLKEVLQSYIDEISAVTINKNQTVKLTMAEETILINSDKRLLKQIIFNLLSNAQKFTSESGLIEIIAGNNGNNYIDIIVKDNGKGISKDRVAAFNDSSSPIHQSHFIAQAEDTGLGLVIVRQLVKLLQGHMIIKSNKGIGTEITLSFPV